MGDDDRNDALYWDRMRLLVQVAETANEEGAPHPSELLRAAAATSDAAQRTMLAGLADLKRAGFLAYPADRSINDEPHITVQGRVALDDMKRRRDHDAAGRNVACRKAIAGWLVRLADQGAERGDWGDFTPDKGNDWYLAPFPEHTIDRASTWLAERGYLTGIPVAETTRLLRPAITSQGESWYEQGASMTDRSSMGGSNFHITAATGSAVGINYGSPSASIAQTVTVGQAEADAAVEAIEGLLEGLPACRLSPAAEAEAREAANELRELVTSGQVDTTRAQSLYDRVKDAVLSGAASKVGGLLITGLFQALMVIFGLQPIG